MMDNQDIRLRRIKLLMRDLNRQIDLAFQQGLRPDVRLVDKTKLRDRAPRYHVELINDERK